MTVKFAQIAMVAKPDQAGRVITILTALDIQGRIWECVEDGEWRLLPSPGMPTRRL